MEKQNRDNRMNEHTSKTWVGLLGRPVAVATSATKVVKAILIRAKGTPTEATTGITLTSRMFVFAIIFDVLAKLNP